MDLVKLVENRRNFLLARRIFAQRLARSEGLSSACTGCLLRHPKRTKRLQSRQVLSSALYLHLKPKQPWRGAWTPGQWRFSDLLHARRSASPAGSVSFFFFFLSFFLPFLFLSLLPSRPGDICWSVVRAEKGTALFGKDVWSTPRLQS